MEGKDLLERLLDFHKSSYDIERPFDVDGDIYDAYAKFCVTSAKYVLVKTAELWRANCFEHTFFRCLDRLDGEDLKRFRKQIVSYIEPELVRGGRKCTEKDHMYSYMTGIFICDGGVADDAAKEIRNFKYFKNYRMALRGYSEARLLVFDVKNRKILGNRAAKEMVKGYSKAGIF